MNGRYLILSGRIHQELQRLDHVVNRVKRIWQLSSQIPDDVYIDAVALNLHGFYAGVERIFEVIANQVDESIPRGERWHIELLQQMAYHVPKVRPAVISTDLRDRLDKYRGFRHVVRNVYTFNLDPQLLQILVEDLPSTFALLEKSLINFADTLEAMGAEED